jgi:hypothetical protein
MQPKAARPGLPGLPPHAATVAQARAQHPATLLRSVRPARAVAQPLLEDDDGLAAALAADDTEDVGPDYAEFWALLAKSSDRWAFTALNPEVALSTTFATGRLAVSARADTATSYRLGVGGAPEQRKWIFWLPWLHGRVAAAPRSDYEPKGSGMDYFFTAGLDGCTFLLTATSVMHVAADYAAGPAGAATGHEVLAEFGPRQYQRESTGRGFVFGVRRGKAWEYYFCHGHFTKNCEHLAIAYPQYPYGSKDHFSIM